MTQQISLKDVTDAEDTCLLLKSNVLIVLACVVHTWGVKIIEASKLGKHYDPILWINILIRQFPVVNVGYTLKPAYYTT